MVKLTKEPPSYGARGRPLDYLINLERSNLLFGDSFRFEGILRTNQGLVIVTSQPFVTGEPATEEDIVEFFSNLGFAECGNHTFQAKERGITIYDARQTMFFATPAPGSARPLTSRFSLQLLASPTADPGKLRDHRNPIRPLQTRSLGATERLYDRWTTYGPNSAETAQTRQHQTGLNPAAFLQENQKDTAKLAIRLCFFEMTLCVF